jgi:DNA-binding response OmpR family regulator
MGPKSDMKQVNGSVRVLIVDDDPETTDLFKILLEPQRFEILTANSGSQGVDLARQENPDVMVVDLFMPEMDGLSVCKEVRKFSNVPILMLSAISKPGLLSQAIEEGADGYLLKPMKSSVLIANINRLARRERLNRAST